MKLQAVLSLKFRFGRKVRATQSTVPVETQGPDHENDWEQKVPQKIKLPSIHFGGKGEKAR